MIRSQRFYWDNVRINYLHKNGSEYMSSFEKNIKYLLGYGPRILNKYIRKIRTKLLKVTNIKQPIKKLMKKIEVTLKRFFTLEESSKSDYRRLGNRYVSKRVYVLLVLLIIAIPVSIYFYILPFAEGRLWEAKLYVNSYKLSDFSGRARILDRDDTIIFKGILENGQINGYGEVYDVDGLIYAGDFQNGAYEGDGVEYNSSLKTIQYEGTFVNNQYSGEGIYYFEDGKRYVGSFAMGLMEGEGKLYTKDYLLYEGSFKDGHYDGQGILYLEDGTIIYQGAFKNGVFEGQGVLSYNYTNRVRYEGEFSQGFFNGDGILYNENSKPIYTGAFKDDHFDYLRYRGEDINVLRAAFGQEDQALLFENSFVTLYYDLNMTVMCNYVSIDTNVIAAQSIVITGENQGCDGVQVGQSIKDFRVVSKENANGYLSTEGMAYLVKTLGDNKQAIQVYDLYTDVNHFVVLTDQQEQIVAIIL